MPVTIVTERYLMSVDVNVMRRCTPCNEDGGGRGSVTPPLALDGHGWGWVLRMGCQSGHIPIANLSLSSALVIKRRHCLTGAARSVKILHGSLS